MPTYTFHSLSAADFEDLCVDLLSAEHGVRFQIFTPGRDGGVDLRHHGGAVEASTDTVVQCKHYWRSGFKALLRSLKSERETLETTNPSRYLVCTSVGLTPANKDAIAELLGPYCRSSQDVYGLDELNHLLRKHPAVERAHHKLWLTSAAMLDTLVHAGAAAWVAMEEDAIATTLATYVETAAYDRAIRILDAHHYCVISGIPGIGKTTLAQVLVAHYLGRGYALVAARDNIQQAIDGLRPGMDQVVYYDDFLGRSSLRERLDKNEDVGLVRLVERARASRGHMKLILTTREYLLREAQDSYERLRHAALDLAKCLVEVDSYTRGVRARILYNHVYFSSLDQRYVEGLLKDRFYLRLVDHRNFNPRVIDWMTRGMGVAGVTTEEFPRVFLKSLDSPVDVWQHAYDHEIGRDGRRLLSLLATFPANASVPALRHAWVAAAKRDGAVDDLSLRFSGVLKQLEGSFLLIVRRDPHTAVSLHNASIADFVRERVRSNADMARVLLEDAAYFEQVSELLRLVEVSGEDKGEHITCWSAELQVAIPRTIRAGLPQRVDYRRDGQVVGSAVTVRDLPILVSTQYRESNAESWSPRGMSLGKRVATCVEWYRTSHHSQLLEVLCTTMEALLTEGLVWSEETVSCTSLIEVLLEEPEVANRHPTLLPGLVKVVEESLEDSFELDDWVTWGAFLRARGRALGCDPDAWKPRVKQFLEDWSDGELQNVDDRGELPYLADEIRRAGGAWAFDVTAIAESIESHEVRERPYRKSQPTPSHSERKTEERSSSDEDIDRLFSTLRGRDDP